MAEITNHLNPAEKASKKALAKVRDCLLEEKNFLVEAGAGAGKTYTLIEALQFLMERHERILLKRQRKIACITFTNVAKDEIEARTGQSDLIHCDTIHAFCWSLISNFQKQLREQLPQLDDWKEKIDEIGEIGDRNIEYDLGHRNVNEHRISIHHDNVLTLTIALMENPKFRRMLADKHPIILIDEYQDTNTEWVDSIKKYFLEHNLPPLFGFFGDHWQKIYGDGCGKIEHPNLISIHQEANFRSVSTIVNCLNRMRPELPQSVVDPNAQGSVRVFHTNSWVGKRRTGGHWNGDLLPNDASAALQSVQNRLAGEGWKLSPGITKILMLTHRVLAEMQGYSSIPQVFKYSESFAKKEHPHIAYFTDALEPACDAYLSRKYGEMFRALGSNVPAIRAQSDKKEWSDAMDNLIELRENGTVGEVLDHLLSACRPRVPDTITKLERELRQFDPNSDEEMSRRLKELKCLRAVPYREIIALHRYLSDHSPFQTKHGVKGTEFENVLVVIGRGWNHYNFNNMLELARDCSCIPASKQATFDRNRNLFYVACSRPKKRLAVLFTQKLSTEAMETVTHWFGEDAVEDLDW